MTSTAMDGLFHFRFDIPSQKGIDMKILSFGLNIMTCGGWGIFRRLLGLFKAKEGKPTFLRAVMVYLVGHSLFSMLTGAISPWAILRGIVILMAMVFKAMGGDPRLPDDEKTVTQRAKEAIEQRTKQIADAAAEQKKAMEEHAAKIRAEADAKIEEFKRNHELEIAKRDLEAKADKLRQQAEHERERLTREAEVKAEQARQLVERERKEAQARADQAIRDAQIAAEEAKRKAEQEASDALFNSAASVVSSAERTFTKNLNLMSGWVTGKDPNRKYHLCPGCNGRRYCQRGFSDWLRCSCGRNYLPNTLPEVD